MLAVICVQHLLPVKVALLLQHVLQHSWHMWNRSIIADQALLQSQMLHSWWCM